mmetsp:Transcript_43777/g.64285  ORF Transcript_43777/g.64285 Transcript_43777/m.64285 type:complete len:85 (+) Transcript_43777:1188-1442(+)
MDSICPFTIFRVAFIFKIESKDGTFSRRGRNVPSNSAFTAKEMLYFRDNTCPVHTKNPWVTLLKIGDLQSKKFYLALTCTKHQQ